MEFEISRLDHHGVVSGVIIVKAIKNRTVE